MAEVEGCNKLGAAGSTGPFNNSPLSAWLSHSSNVRVAVVASPPMAVRPARLTSLFLALALVGMGQLASAQVARCLEPTSDELRSRALVCSMTNCGDTRYVHAYGTYTQATRAPTEAARELYCVAARQLDEAIQDNPRYYKAEVGRFLMAQSTENCGYPSEAAQILMDIERVNRERLARDGQQRHDCQTIDLLANARFSAGDTWERLGRHEAAFTEFAVLVEDDRSEASSGAAAIRRMGTLRYVELARRLHREDDARLLLERLLARPTGSFGANGSEFLRSLLPRLTSP